jgi:hypothetical protein
VAAEKAGNQRFRIPPGAGDKGSIAQSFLVAMAEDEDSAREIGWPTFAEDRGFADENWTDTAQGTRIDFLTTLNGAASISERMRITNDGKVGIGTTAPADKLSVEGIVSPQTDNAYTLGSSSKRWSDVYAVSGTVNTSDARLKTDIEDSRLGLAFILNCRPRAYRWLEGGVTVEWDGETKREVKRTGARTHYGLVAQEVQAALSLAGVDDFAGWVLADKADPNSTQGLRYDQFIAPLIKAVQELAARVETLEAQRAAS